ncbi:MAG: patatin-like phospholipase family protein [Candidatus Melainabacteria bacterium]|nr:patatin-like phospholipase family protein [Candidatus Melainabacteria bacterium]
MTNKVRTLVTTLAIVSTNWMLCFHSLPVFAQSATSKPNPAPTATSVQSPTAKPTQAPTAAAPTVAVDTVPSSGDGQSIYQTGLPVETGNLLSEVKNPRLALILAGGGARGAAHIGVLKVFDREKIHVDFLVGSSVGALVGSLYCAGVSARDIEALVLSNQLKKAFYPIPFKLKAALGIPPYMLKRLIFLKPPIGLYSGNSIAKFIERNLPPGIEKIEQLKTPFAALTVNLGDTRPVWLDKGNIAKAVQASCSVPMLYRPVVTDGKLFVDGGLRNNLPTEPATAVGAQIVVAVKLHAFLKGNDQSKFNTFSSYGDQLLGILMAEIEDKPAGQADIVIEPNADKLNLHNFNRADLIEAIKSGEEAAEKALPAIKARINASH